MLLEKETPVPEWDVVVVGAGPGGLSTALWLGRCRRRVLVVDAGGGRNAAAHGIHGLLTRDGIAPAELRRLGRQELVPYEVAFREATVSAATHSDGRFELTLDAGESVSSRALVLATGVRDRMPEVDGLEEFYGTTVHHCPYCDGWEHRDQRLAVHGRGRAGFALAKKLLTWSTDVVLCTDGASRLTDKEKAALDRLGIPISSKRLARLEGRGTTLERLRFRDGSALDRDAVFFTLGWDLASNLAQTLGCRLTRKGCIRTDEHQETSVPRLYVVGDASRDVQLVVAAAAEGAKAALQLHEQLLEEDLAGERQS